MNERIFEASDRKIGFGQILAIKVTISILSTLYASKYVSGTRNRPVYRIHVIFGSHRKLAVHMRRTIEARNFSVSASEHVLLLHCSPRNSVIDSGEIIVKLTLKIYILSICSEENEITILAT